jgi:hypothetical protein
MLIFRALSRYVRDHYNNCVRTKRAGRIVERAEAILHASDKQQRQAQQDRNDYAAKEKKDLRVAIQQFAIAKAQVRVAQRLNCLTGIGGFFAFVAALGVCWSVLEAREATIDANRAWIASIEARLGHPLRIGDDKVAISVSVLNTGHSPALDTVYSAIVDAAPDGHISDKRVCSSTIPKEGQAALFPSDHLGGDLSFSAQFVKDKNAVADVMAARQILYVMGCSAYRTMGQTHHTGFCFYLQPELGPQTGQAVAKPVNEWVFKKCPIANTAD